MKFAIYTPATGQIQKLIDCPDATVAAINAGAGEGWLAVTGDVFDNTHYIEAGHAVSMGAQPTLHHVFDFGVKQWIDPRSLAELKAQQWELVKRDRQASEFGGFTWDGSSFDSDLISQSRIQGAAQLATISASQGAPFSIDWTLADNSVRTLTGMDMVSVGIAMGTHIATQHAIGRALREQIEAATTFADVVMVTWPHLLA